LIDCSPNGVTGKFAKYIPGLINWLVQMPEKDMRAYLMETNEKVPFMNQYAMQQQRQSNPLMDWMAECVIFDPSIMTYVGSAKLAPKDSTRKYAYAEHKLYANYREFCDENGTNSMSRARFENAIKDIFTNQLKLHIYKDNNRTARFFNVNLRGRPDQNGRIDASKAAHYPSVLELAINPDQYRDFYGNAVITLKDYQQSKQEIV
jgi:putative DNA primase/helicase